MSDFKRRQFLRAICFSEELETRTLFAAPPLPVIPAGTFLITTYGATTASLNNATQIQAAINAASAAGGGTVEVPAGTWMSGPITLATKIRLQVDSGATLKAVAMANYPNNTAPANWISTSSKNNIEVVGPGTLDGNGQDWWTAYIANNTISRPRIFNMTGSDTVYIHNIRVQNSPQFNIAISTTNNVNIDGVTIFNPTSNTSNISPNTDGIDIGGSHWLIQNCNIDTGDDNIVVKPGSTASSDMTITNCFFGHGHGLSIGGQTNLGLNGLYCSNITFDGTTAGIRMKASRIAGGLVQNCFYDNMTMYNVQYPINLHSYYLDGSVPNAANTQEPPQAITSLTPYWQNISISNITSTWDSTRASYYSGAFSGSYAGIVWGLPEAPIKNVQFTNINMTSGKYGFAMNHVRNVHFDRATVITPNPSTNQDFISNKNSTTVLPYDAVYWTDADINAPTSAGNAIYDVTTGNTTVTGGGADFGTTSTDQFNFTSTSLTGDAHFYAKVNSQSSTNATAKAGVMIRNSSANNSAFAAVVVTPTSGVQFRWRASDGGTLGSTTVTGQTAPLFVRLSRSGSSFTAYYSANGTTWTQIGTAQTVTMTNTSVLAGLAVTSANNASAINSAVFSNVELMQWLVSPAATPSPVTGTTAALSAIATNSLGDNLLTNTWSATSIPAGATTPTFSPNATALSNFSTETFFKAGVYSMQLAVTDGNGLSLSKTLALTVNQTLTSIVISPSTVNLNSGATQQFTATARDQFTASMTSQPTFTWTLSPALGTITTGGLYTAGSSPGTDTITATSGTISGVATAVMSGNGAPYIVSPAVGVMNRSGGTDYFVDATGANGAYTTVQAALDAVAGQSASNRARIYILPGTYSQQITISKPYVSLIGLGAAASNTVLTFNLGSVSGNWNASNTITSAATDFLASNITFSNTLGFGAGQALAVRDSADRSVFTNCRFLGYQDTLLVDNNSRQYFKSCYIEGNTDFIFGNATAVFDSCTINSYSSQFISAPETNPTTANGLIFLDCTLTTTLAANNSTYLARPWHWDTGQIPSAIYIRTRMGPHIIAAGWDPWSTTNTTPDVNTRFSEFGSMDQNGNLLALNGSGVPTGRVTWADPMTAAQAANYTLTNIFGPASFWTATTQPEITGQTYISQGANWDPLATLATLSNGPGLTAKLRVLGNDDQGEAGLKYTWAATTIPSGATTPTFSVNGTNAAKSTTVTFFKSGTYTFTLSIADALNATTTTTVTITVNETLTSIAVTPSSATVGNATITALTASAKDQFGNAMTAQPTFTWSIDAGGIGSVNSNGQYTAPGTGFGSAVVRATSGSISGTSSINVQLSIINGTSGADTIRQVRNGANLEIYINSATATFTVPFASQPAMTINGLGGNDAMIVDYSAGVPVPAAGLTVDGGTNTDSLTIVGTTGVDSATFNSTSAILAGTTTTQANLESIQFDGKLGGDSVTLNSGATVNLPATQVFSTLTMNAGSVLTLVAGSGAVLDVTTLNENATAKIDLTNNAIVLRTAGALAASTSKILSGQNGFDNNGIVQWNGNGITSSSARANNVSLGVDVFGIGAIRNGDIDTLNGAGSKYTTWKGRSVGTEDVLIRYTYLGDADMNGTITIDDYNMIDASYLNLQPNLGWLSGNFDFQGSITIDDYNAIDTGYLYQTGPLGS